MKKWISLIMILSLVLLCGCNSGANPSGTTAPDTTNAAATQETTGGVTETTKPIEWETPIDVDDSFIDEQPENTNPQDPTEAEPTESTEAQDPSDPTDGGTESEPAATEPEATKPAASEPPFSGGPTGSKPIELPMIPG